MVNQTHLWKEEALESEDKITIAAIIESPRLGRERLWYQIPSEFKSYLTDSWDPFVLGSIFTAMSESTDLVVHGPVSPSLLRNLEEFQAIWACWLPGVYKRIEVIPESEEEYGTSDRPGAAVAAFTGGVDSCFTIFRHGTGRCGRERLNLEAGLFVHGFDIGLEQADAFERAARRAKATVDSIGLKLITIASNYKKLNGDWNYTHGAGVASSLMVLKGHFTEGLIASTDPYHAMVLPWGSSPITDYLLSSDSFRIVHDGASFPRVAKIKEIAHWPQAVENIRVCWSADRQDENCGRCEKCVMSILGFRLWGLGLPPSFPHDITNQQIMALEHLYERYPASCPELLKFARELNVSESWVHSLERRFRYSERIAALEIPTKGKCLNLWRQLKLQLYKFISCRLSAGAFGQFLQRIGIPKFKGM